jgi:(p)ppGpp synthase/HD superfamily hydrolase
MTIEGRDSESIPVIPEMPKKRHIPEVVKWFESQKNHQLIEARERLEKKVKLIGLDPKAQRSILETAALAGWIHRNDTRITGEPYIVHPLDATTKTIGHPAIPFELMPRAAKGLLLHDAIEDNKNVTYLALFPHVGFMVTQDIVIYSRKNARDKSRGLDTEISPETYLHRFLSAQEHIRIGKVNERINNMENMPPGAEKMYDRYFRKEKEWMLKIIRSLGETGRTLYEDYKDAHNQNKPEDVPELPPYEEFK